MYKITITKDSAVTNEASFPTLKELEKWKANHVEMGTFRFEDKVVPASLTVFGDILEKEHILPKTHEFTIEDLTEQAEAEAEKDDKLKAAKKALKSVDIEGATTIAKLKPILKLLLDAQE